MHLPPARSRMFLLGRVGLLCLAALALALVSCDTLTSIGRPPTPVPTVTLAPTNTPTLPPPPPPTTAPPPTARPTNTPVAPTSTPVPVATTMPTPNPASAKLLVKDLPAGFREPAAADLKKMNLTDDGLSIGFSQVFTQTRPQNLTVFAHPQKSQIVASFVFFSLSPAERTSLTAQFATPESAYKAYSAALLGASGLSNGKVLPSFDKVGDKSFVVGTTLSVGGANVRAESALVTRAQVAEIVMSFYPDGTAPAITLADLARVYDLRVANALAGR